MAKEGPHGGFRRSGQGADRAGDDARLMRTETMPTESMPTESMPTETVPTESMPTDPVTPHGRTRRDLQAAEAARRGLAAAGWSALGTSVQLVVTDPAALPVARVAVEEVLASIDLAASRFRPDSELTRLNLAQGAWCDVSPLFARTLRVALDAAAWTGGMVDPTVGASLIDLGYDRTFRLVPSDGPPTSITVRPAPGWRQVEMADDDRRVRCPAGTLLDLGATAKGLASDLAAEAAFSAAGCGVLVSLGGDIAVAGAAPGGTGPDAGWPVLVTDLSDPDLPALPAALPAFRGDAAPSDPFGERDQRTAAQTVLLREGGLATSSISARRWRRGGSVLHHIIDPRSGLPAHSPWRTISVTARTCVLANTATTAAMVLGPQAVEWLSRRGFSSRLIDTDGQAVRLGGWPADVTDLP